MRLQKAMTLLPLLMLAQDNAFAKNLTYQTPEGMIIIPESSQPKVGKDMMTTDLIITKPKKKLANGLPYGETPASLACVYGLTTQVPGCNINTVSEKPSGGQGGVIAIVDGNYNPYAISDLNYFAQQMGYTDIPNITQIYAKGATSRAAGLAACGGTQPLQGWWDEQVLDIEMAFAMAPKAQIFLVEAQSGSTPDLLVAVSCATSMVQEAGGGIVSMSWSKNEFPSEVNDDIFFQNSNVVYISSAGDYSKPARYPSASPYVISAGGTSIERDANGNFTQETAWSTNTNAPPNGKSGGSGGPSMYEPRPFFQNVVQRIVGNRRGTPDISSQANFRPGVVIYSTQSGGWITAGGTSAASPLLAGIITAASHHATSSQAELAYIYGYYPKAYHSYWHDIQIGYNGYHAMAGYDFVTGLGSPRSYLGK
jgi:subtilase family serine protease